jgi:hypothetical protein
MRLSEDTGPTVGGVRLFPSVRAGRGLPPDQAVRAWATAGWLLAVEGRALLEDLEGGANQPQLRQMVRLQLVELLTDVDIRLGGGVPPDKDHLLAVALEYGLHDVAELDGERLVRLFGLDGEFGTAVSEDGEARAFWDRLCEAFPGQLPDPLQADGQREILQALRLWSKLCTAAGTDAAFLEPFLKDA